MRGTSVRVSVPSRDDSAGCTGVFGMRTLLSVVAAFLAVTVASADGHAQEAGLYFGADFGLFDFELPGKAGEPHRAAAAANATRSALAQL